MEELLKKLDGVYGVSGREGNIAKVVSEEMKKMMDEVTVDNLGSVIGVKHAKCPHPTRVLLEADMDEIGLMVKDITEDGFLLFVTIGGIDPKILPGTEVIIHGKKEYLGVIGAMPPHLQTEKEDKVLIKNMAIDAGLSFEEAKANIKVGDTVTFKTAYTRLLGSRCAARCLDDRAGLAVILKAAELIKNPNVELYLSASVQEEVGLRGAGVAARRILPDIAVAVDVTHGDTPDADKRTFPIGEGPAVLIGPNAHPMRTRELISYAKRNEIPIQIEVDGDGDSGTDAAIMQVQGEGIATMLLSIPLRYMHTNYEVMDLKDAEEASRLLAGYVNEMI